MLLPTLFLLLSTAIAAAYDDPCPTTTCGNVNISYPFYTVSTTSASIPTSYCGYPGLALTCSYSAGDPIPTAFLTLPISSSYVVKAIDYVSNAISLVDSDVVFGTAQSNSCLRVRHNLTIDNYPLTSRNLNLAFYFNCSNVSSLITAIECLSETGDEDDVVRRRKSYVFESGKEPVEVDWGRVCEERVVAAVEKGRVDLGDLDGRYEEALRLGFVLDWGLKKGVQCVNCEKSGGRCGFRRVEADAAAEEFVCYCKDGSAVRRKCKRSKFSLPKAFSFEVL